ncbi:MAG TPA: PKD domain-containing protein [Microthrixaceae bacterium]|jgi:PKD repeat protein|nr:PKD domain-containing protein [Microthrixaceae bacterium]
MKIRTALVAATAMAVAIGAAACTPDPGPAQPTNKAPVADIAASDVTGSAPLTVSFDAGASVDPDGTIVNYHWDFGDDTTANGKTAIHTFAPGKWTVQLAVTDNGGAIGTTSSTIIATNTAPVADFSITPSGGVAPLNATFDASTLSSDVDGTIVNYAWNFGDLGTDSGATVAKTLPAGTFNVTLTVTDNNGATATKTRTVTAAGAPVAPTGLTNTGAGSIPTPPWADFKWNPVPGADAYQINMDSLIGCTAWNPSAVFEGQASSARLQQTGVCQGTRYNVTIRARANGQWGPWSPALYINAL